MKKPLLSICLVATAMLASYVIAADHIDAPAVGSLSSGSQLVDITDFYAFESPSNSDNYVFIANASGLLAPSQNVSFTEDLMYEFNIDNNGDNIEDMVIQAIFRDDRVIVRGPEPTSETGMQSTVINSDNRVEAKTTAMGESMIVGSNNGISIFAGPRDDPFFMDFFKFVDIVNGAGAALGLSVPAPADGNAYATSFDATGADTFAGTNVMSIVVEVPKSMLGSGTTFTSWLESKSSL